MKKWLNQHWLLLSIVVMALVTRLLAAHFQSFSNDELSALYRLNFADFIEFIHWGIKVDGHPAFVQLFLFGYSEVVPTTELWIRLPFVLASTASLIFIFYTIKRISGEFSAYLVIIIMGFAGFSVQLGYFARPYAFGILFSSGAAYYWMKIFMEREKGVKNLLAFILFGILTAYTHYFALLVLVVLGMATFVFSHWKIWWKIILSGLIIFLAYLPHYPITAFQLSVGGIGGWLGKPGPEFIFELLFTYFNSSWIIIGIISIALTVILILYPKKPEIRNWLLLIFITVVPFLILYQYSIRVNAILQLSACYFFMPFLLAGMTHLVEPAAEKKIIHRILVPVLLVYLTYGFMIKPVHLPLHFAEFKRIAAFIEEHENDTVTTIVAVNNPAYIDFYLKDKKPDLYITDMGDNLSFLKRFVDTCETNEIIYAYANQRSNAEIPYMIQSEYGALKSSSIFINSGYYHYKKSPLVSNTLQLQGMNFAFDRMKGDFEMVKPEQKENYSSYPLTSEIEFGPTFKIKLSDYKLNSSHEIVSQVQLMFQEFCDVQLVISVENEKGVKFWRSRKLYHQLSNINLRWFEIEKQLMPTTMYNCSLIIAENLQDGKIEVDKDYLKVYLWNPNHCQCLVTKHSVWILNTNQPANEYSQ